MFTPTATGIFYCITGVYTEFTVNSLFFLTGIRYASFMKTADTDKTVRHKGKKLIDFPDEYVVVDTETTGLSPALDSIIELGAIRYVNHRETERFTQLVKPDKWTVFYHTWDQIEPICKDLAAYEENGIHITNKKLRPNQYVDYPAFRGCQVRYVSPFITELTGITDEMLNDAPMMKDVLPSFLDFVGDSIIVGHNVNFDINFIYDTVMKYIGIPFTNDFVDTLLLSQKLLSMPHHRLQDLAEYYGMDYSHAHRAVEDAHMTAQALEHMRKLVIDQYGSVSAFIENQVRYSHYRKP